MTREGYNKHRALFKQWLNGAEIEYFSPLCDAWLLTASPNWDIDTKYRIKQPNLEVGMIGYDNEGNKVEILATDIKQYEIDRHPIVATVTICGFKKIRTYTETGVFDLEDTHYNLKLETFKH